MPPDCTVLEIYFVRFPLGDPIGNESLWKEVDEQYFPPSLRQSLLRNGFRVGLVGSPIPQPLADLMELEDKLAAGAEAGSTKIESFGSTPHVVCRHLQARAGRRNEVVASGVYEELPVLVYDSGRLCGRTYPKAQGIFALTADPEPDGRVRLRLVPELHYGEARQRWVGSEGAFRMEPGRSRRVFDDFAVSATISPGCMLLLSSLPNRSGSIGHSFFNHTEAGKLEQKLLVIRLVQTQHDGLFNPAEPLPLDRLP